MKLRRELIASWRIASRSSIATLSSPPSAESTIYLKPQHETSSFTLLPSRMARLAQQLLQLPLGLAPLSPRLHLANESFCAVRTMP